MPGGIRSHPENIRNQLHKPILLPLLNQGTESASKYTHIIHGTQLVASESVAEL